MAESEQIWWTYVKIENVAEIYSARIDSSAFRVTSEKLPADPALEGWIRCALTLLWLVTLKRLLYYSISYFIMLIIIAICKGIDSLPGTCVTSPYMTHVE